MTAFDPSQASTRVFSNTSLGDKTDGVGGVVDTSGAYDTLEGTKLTDLSATREMVRHAPVELAAAKARQQAPVRRAKRPTKAPPIHTSRDMTVAEGFATIVASCLLHFRKNEPIVKSARNVEALHQARVAIRRLRSALSLFRRAVSDHEFERIEHELRWFTAELGDARVLDVYLELELSEEQRRFVGERRGKAYDVAITAMDSPRFGELAHDITGWAETGAWRKTARAEKSLHAFTTRRLDTLWSDICGAKKIADMDDLQRHHLRIRMKKLRYGLEFVAALHTRRPRRKRKLAKIAGELQESLGNLHDIVSARSLVALNSWLSAPSPSRREERRIVRSADRALDQLRSVGRYWH